MNFKQLLIAASFAVGASTCSAPVLAASFNSFSANALGSSDGFSFDKDTKVNFDFIASHGGYQSRFGVFEKTASGLVSKGWLFSEKQAKDPGSNNSNDSLGTCPTTVSPCSNAFTFLKGVTYLLGLENIVPTGGLVLSNNPVTNADRPGMQFIQGPGDLTYPTKFAPPNGTQFTSVNLTARQVGILVNDSWTGDMDKNDFVLKAEAVPEPATLAGLGMVAGGMLLARRRKVAALLKR